MEINLLKIKYVIYTMREREIKKNTQYMDKRSLMQTVVTYIYIYIYIFECMYGCKYCMAIKIWTKDT